MRARVYIRRTADKTVRHTLTRMRWKQTLEIELNAIVCSRYSFTNLVRRRNTTPIARYECVR